jgi:glycosyltransferase involved in cell wall biosynthesis
MRVLGDHVRDFEVIVVNDGSFDDTPRVLAEFRVTYTPRLRVITHPANQGYGAALRTGFEAASKEFVFYTDGDAQYDVGELPLLLDKMDTDVGLVNGYKLERNDPFHRIWIGHVYNAFARTVFRLRIRDVDCDFRLIRSALLRSLNLQSTSSGTICVELVRQIELSPWRVVEVGVHHYPRLYGRSEFFRVPSLVSTLCQIVILYWRVVLRRSTYL